MSGRASGRARGRAPAEDSPESGMSGSPGGSSPGAGGDAFRGRGGFRPAGLLTTRPDGTTTSTGTGGREVGLLANYFKMETDESACVWDFRVDFEPQVESVKVRRLLVQKFADRFRNSSGKAAFLFDGFSNLKSMNPLDPTAETVVLETVNEMAAQPGDNPPVQKLIFKRAEQAISWGSFEMMRLYNTQMRRNFQHLGWMMIYREYYDPATTIAMPQFSVNVMLGFTTATNLHEGGILMACDAINKIIRRDTVLEAMRNLLQRGGNFQDNCRRELVGSIVMTTYNNRTYKIDDLDFVQNPQSKFDRQGRGKVTYVDYYKEQYQLTISDAGQPLIVCLPTVRDKRAAEQRGQTARPCLLIPEFCVMTGLSESLRANFDLKRQLTQSTQLAPQQRFEQLRRFRHTLESNAAVQTDLNVWNLKYSMNVMSLTGRVLDPERILMQNVPQGIPVHTPGDFSKEMRGQRMLVPQAWKTWAVIFPNRDGKVVDDFLLMLKRVCGPLGLNLSSGPKLISLVDDRTSSYVRGLTGGEWPYDPEGMVVVVFPNNNQERYSAVKKICCIEHPCASQCLLTRTLGKPAQLMSVATKVCLQMACKAGSQAWGVDMPVKSLMVIGFDTYHDGARKGESVGAFVCSLNQALTQYYSRVSYHKSREEMSTNIAANFRVALQEYQKRNGGELPDKVVMFRDGVGEGMIRHVHEVEVQQMKKVLEKVSGAGTESGQIKLGFVIVTKRINTKFFLKAFQEGRQVVLNPPPGLIVDTVVTRPERLEFYLVAQSVRAGTVAPTSFNVIHNTTGWQPRHFQMMSYKLCHMYFNWPGTIRVPAPCQYAHKLAFLTGTALHREPNTTLSDRLFYL